VTARKQEHIAADRAETAHHFVGARADLRRRFAARATFAEQLPIRTVGMDLDGGAAFILPVVPLDEIAIRLRDGAEPRERACPGRALQRTCENSGEWKPREPRAEL
jgi:hypothetical protein